MWCLELMPPEFLVLANLNPNLTKLRLDFCGRMDDAVMDSWRTSFPSLTHIDLFGPFLVRRAGWVTFFSSHPNLESFRITQSPRFDLDCMQAMVKHCPSITELRLKEVERLDDGFLLEIRKFEKGITVLDLSDPCRASCSEAALIELMIVTGPTLTLLDLSGNHEVTDRFLIEGLGPHMRVLTTLALNDIPQLTDEGVGKFFEEWRIITPWIKPSFKGKGKRKSKADTAHMVLEVDHVPNPPLIKAEFSRNHNLGSASLAAIIAHSRTNLISLSINGWSSTSSSALSQISTAKQLRELDVGWCREMNDEVMEKILNECGELNQIKCWGCSQLTDCCPRKVCFFDLAYKDPRLHELTIARCCDIRRGSTKLRIVQHK